MLYNFRITGRIIFFFVFSIVCNNIAIALFLQISATNTTTITITTAASANNNHWVQILCDRLL
jgi:hypothetical protein